jgi:hypothetical protein
MDCTTFMIIYTVVALGGLIGYALAMMGGRE